MKNRVTNLDRMQHLRWDREREFKERRESKREVLFSLILICLQELSICRLTQTMNKRGDR